MSDLKTTQCEQLQQDHALQLKQYTEVAEALRLNLNPSDQPKLETQLAILQQSLVVLEQQMQTLGCAEAPTPSTAVPPVISTTLPSATPMIQQQATTGGVNIGGNVGGDVILNPTTKEPRVWKAVIVLIITVIAVILEILALLSPEQQSNLPLIGAFFPTITPTPTHTLTPTLTLTPTYPPTWTPTPIATYTPSKTTTVPPRTATYTITPPPAYVDILVGEAIFRVYYSSTVSASESMKVRLQLEFISYAITPTPFGPVTFVPASAIATAVKPTPLQASTTPTATPLRTSDVVGIFEQIEVALVCSEQSFTGCDTKGVESIKLSNTEWLWTIKPVKEAFGQQDLYIEVKPVAVKNANGEYVQTVWRHDFKIDVQPADRLTSTDILSNIIPIVVALLGLAGVIGAALLSAGIHPFRRAKQPKDENPPKTATPRPTVFISYRRRVGWSTARNIHDNLEKRGADVFLDVDDLYAGDFAKYLQENIDQREFFILVLAPSTLESEWVVKEVQHAHSKNKPIIPVLVDGFDLYGKEISDHLKFLQAQNAVTLAPEFYAAGIDKIAEFIGLK